MMMLGSKDTRRIVPHFVLSQFCKKFGIRGSPSTLRFGRCLALRTLKIPQIRSFFYEKWLLFGVLRSS